MAGQAVLATFGTLGDIYPFIAIALALEERGLHATLAAPDTHQRAIEDEGLRFVRMRPNETNIIEALGTDVPGAYRLMLKNPHFILDEIYMRFLRDTYEDVLQAGAGADVIITHSLLVGASQAAEMLRIPSARVALAPLHLQSAVSPPLTPGAPYWLQPRTWVEMAYNRVVRQVVRLATRARMRRLRRFRAEVGLPPTNEDFFLDFGRCNTAGAVFGLFSPRFAPPQPDHPANLIVPGFPFYRSRDPARRALDPALRAFLNAGEPPVVFTLGSFAPEVSEDFYDHSLRIARNLGRRAVLLAGERDAARLAPTADRTAFVCARAPHALLFPRALCVVHHGGIGTTAEAIRAGLPQLVVPFFGDQSDHGARVVRHGLGLTLDLACYNERSVMEALRILLAGDYHYTAANFAAATAGEDGIGTLADWAQRVTTEMAFGNDAAETKMT